VSAFRILQRAALGKAAGTALAAVFIAGCAGVPTGTHKPETTFYPPPPQPPRIQHLATFSSDGDLAPPSSGFARFILGEDKTSRQLQRPYGVALFEGKLYVADSRGPGLVVFDLAQKRLTLVTGKGQGRMKRPINVTIDADGTKYVTDTARDQILVYDREERFIAAFGAEGQFKPVDTAIAAERLYVADIQHHEVQVLDKRSGKLLFKFGKPGSGAGELYYPTNLAIGADGGVYVVETGNFRVQRFTAEGKAVRSYGQIGSAPGSFARPKGIALDRAGRMYVTDAAFQNVQIFDADGRLLLFFGQPGDGAEGLALPAGIAIDYENVDLFRPYADDRFVLEYVILVASQFGPNKIDVFGFGKMNGTPYLADAPPPASRAR
jgi:DNA-binding beta-propeller fold protein YncE